ncbi:PadR family transcriptional regulator [Clostridium luticellarii]|uniref:PadR family transcriptional regulator n=1 Tax=Clostridium luticellarii TaxID=1691940 RepID=UPI0023554A28|nr:PadR family transcriptional regulator [Clostridium luticellarii]MCI1946253.1 PadR family transcriptional regulator [Clostridium luticellarii]MCI1969383.1 PadR family transcriptional regulator [Clostridium luticellarii]MCI1996418.1 PadR family transcriptional regulator [Clostridium luticellarii]MCI2040771.1 PadR family transcriptional regulator [Clostridium luticellarii]
MKQTQLLKGVLEGCVLLIVLENQVYGYEMIQLLKKHGFKEIVAGTVYPLLQKLEKQGYLSSTIKPSPEGPDRRYYYITPEGKAHCRDFIEQWEDLASKVDNLICLKGEKLHE